jgi:hypothetical protein
MRRRSGLLGTVLVSALALAAGAPASAVAAAPANDSLSGAQVIHTLPTTLTGTTVGASTEPNEVGSGCGLTTNSVWYAFRAGSPERIAVDIAAAGTLDATVTVYHAIRSQLNVVSCQETDAEGHAALSFAASRNGLYYIRVGAREGSQQNTFTLDAFLPTPAVAPPGQPLPTGGASGQVDRIQNVNAAYHLTMRAGVSYLINLANETPHACVSAALFAPGTTTFEEGSPLLHIHCGGFRLFTPRAGQGGRYVIELTPRESHSGVQRFHIQAGVADSTETAPGLVLGNDGTVHGALAGRGVRVLRLYRLDVTSHSNLSLKLFAPESAHFSVQLRDLFGNVLGCQCEGNGRVTLQQQLQSGHYYVVVSERDSTSGSFALLRESRTITSTAISFSSRTASPGQPGSIDLKVSPGVSGPARVDIERFDPVFGWQFFAQERTFVSAGSGSVPFTPPAVGRWRAEASFEGSRTSSSSGTNFAYLLVS